MLNIYFIIIMPKQTAPPGTMKTLETIKFAVVKESIITIPTIML